MALHYSTDHQPNQVVKRTVNRVLQEPSHLSLARQFVLLALLVPLVHKVQLNAANVQQVTGANLLERPNFQLVRSALLEHLAVAKSVRPRAVAKPAVLVLSAPATTSVSNARQEGTAARLVLQHASSALWVLLGHLLVLHRVISACLVQVEPPLSIRKPDLKINANRLAFIPPAKK